MRYLITICLISMIWNASIGQTEKIEKENLNQKILKGQISSSKSKQLGKDWRKLMESNNGYPRLPFDTVNKIIRFQYTVKADDSKKGIYSKIKEWSSLKFGQISKILRYEDYETGRIFIDGYFSILLKPGYHESNYRNRKVVAQKTCYFTFMFTIKDGKFKVEATNILYEYYFPDYSTETNYIPEKSVELNLHNLYPITNYPSEAWKENLELMLITKNEFYRLVLSIKDYIDVNKEIHNF